MAASLSKLRRLVMALFSPRLNAPVKSLPELKCQPPSYHLAMKDIYGIRRANLNALIGRPPLAGAESQRDLMALLGISSASMFSQVKHPDYNIGDKVARVIEVARGLAMNWLDNDHERSHTERPDPAILSAALTLLRLCYMNLEIVNDHEEDGTHLATAYSYLLARKQRGASAEAVIDFSKVLRAAIRG